MSLYATLEPLIVGAAVIACALVVLRKQAPRLWLKLSGRSAAAACGSCGSGCGNCSSGPTQSTVHLHRKP
ncbi:DUF6587 family protein [Uliginosibacterium sediminicola]|uniref:DUF6587 family protein n=1 Tax=Uliginosibacterium sediminicola TaxID=2024550 RepID=A0ABU9Z2G9_9RHOO